MCVFVYLFPANGGLHWMMNVGFPKRKTKPESDLNQPVNLTDFGFAKKIVGVRQHLNLDSNSITSLHDILML